MTVHRRRGPQLEREILQAARTVLADQGYTGLTYEGVAAVAGTSKAVLYRRWPTKAKMVVAALADTPGGASLKAPDTGSLAGDLRALLRAIHGRIRNTDRATALNLLATLDTGTAQSFYEAFLTIGSEMLEPILINARERGELGPRPIPERARALPFDLLRHDALLRGGTSGDIDTIIDECVVPLFVTLSQSRGRSASPEKPPKMADGTRT